MAEVVVPGGKDSEQPREKPKTDGETRRAKEQSARRQEARDKARREAEKKPSSAEATEGKPETLHKPQVEIPFKDAREIAKVVTAIQDEKGVIVSPKELANFKKILTRYGRFDSKAVEKMTAAEIVVAAQGLLKHAKVVAPQEDDFEYVKGSKNRRVEEYLVKEEIAKAGSDSEEELTLEKVKQYLQVEEFGKATKKGGPGAAGVADWTEGLPDEATASPELCRYIQQIKKLKDASELVQHRQLPVIEGSLTEAILKGEITDEKAKDVQGVLEGRIDELSLAAAAEARGEREVRRVISRREEEIEAPTREIIDRLMRTTGAEQDKAKAELEQVLAEVEREAAKNIEEERVSYKKVYFVTKAIKGALSDYRDQLPEELKKQLREFIDERDGSLAKLGNKFREKYRQMTPGERKSSLADIETDATAYFKQITSGFGVTIDEAKELLLRRIGKESEDPTGIREWRAVYRYDGLDNAVRVTQFFEIPVNWEETPEFLTTIYNFVEATDLSVEDMGETIQRAIMMIRNVAPDTIQGRATREKLIKELEAFRAFHSLRITLEKHDMDPTNFTELYRNYFDDETLANFIARFGRDKYYRRFIIRKVGEDGKFVDKEGRPTDDEAKADYEEINLVDISFELYSEQLRQERIKMNIVEEMTRHAIENPFSESELRSFEKWIGCPLTPELRANIRSQIEELRQYFKAKMQAKIDDPKNPDLKGKSVDDIWGRKEVLKVNGKEIWCLNVTHDVIEEWHNKKTLQGAFGIVNDPDIDLLMEEFGITDREEARDRFLGKSFLKIRRGELMKQLVEDLKKRGLMVRVVEGKEPKSVDFEDLIGSGFLGSVDQNAYHFAWMMEWSTYDSIRIYSRDSKSKWDDDYDHIVFHAGTNLFFGRQIDQTWEFLHEQNENRGRPKENDVNRIWKSFLPGKHSWVFPQNGTMTRWADFFMTDEQRDKVERRTRDLMREKDFDNKKHHDDFYGWMRSVVKRDMIESGEISFGKGAARKLSEVAEAGKLRKFEFIDLFIDRASHKKFTDPPIFQTYLANPTEGSFIEMNDKVKGFYSTRDARQFPWMTLAYRAHLEVVMHHNKRLFDVDDATSTQMEELADGLVTSGNMEKEQGVGEKRKNLGLSNLKIGGKLGPLPFPVIYEGELPWIFGTTPFRRARQYLEAARKGTYDSKFGLLLLLFGFWAGVVELAKQLPKQLTQQVSGR